MLREAWLPVVGYEGLYEVSNLGRVRSLDRLERGKGGIIRKRAGRILRFGKLKGYHCVGLCKEGRMKSVTVHRLVAIAFNGYRPGQLRHLDGDRFNNTPGNLVFGSAKENAADREAHGMTARGEKSGMSVRTEAEVRNIKRLAITGLGPTAIGRIVGMNKSRVWEIMKGRIWRHVQP